MNSELSQVAVVWMKKSDGGKGIRLTSAQIDLLNAIGVGELIASAAAKAVTEKCQRKRSLSTKEADINSSKISDEMVADARRSTRSFGMTNKRDEIEAARRARLRVMRPKSS